MANIFDYLDWRGDLSFESDGLNEVDNLILSLLSYLKLDGIVPQETGGNITLSDIADQFTDSKLNPSEFFYYLIPEKISELLQKAAKTPRFQNITLSGYVNRVDHEISNQFSAVVFSICPDEHFIAFRGTDNSIAGWKEDFRMSFQEEVLAQSQSVSYAHEIITALKGKFYHKSRFYLGGHSKGGNLAVYAATHVKPRMRSQIVKIYNNDGPGFHENVIKSEGYQSMSGIIETIIPKSSLIGLLLEHGEGHKIVESSGRGIMQHDAFLWEVKGRTFLCEKELSKSSRNLDYTIRSWLESLSIDQRELFIDGLFDLIQGTGVHTFKELTQDKGKAIDAMIRKYKSMDPETKSFLKKTLDQLFKEGRSIFGKSVRDDIELVFSKLDPRKQT